MYNIVKSESEMDMKSKRKFHPLMQAGLLILVGAELLLAFGHFRTNAANAVIGCLFGVSLALMLFGFFRMKNSGASD